MTFATLVNGVILPIVDLAVLPVLYSIAFVVFLIGIVRFFFSENEEQRKNGRQFALWGIIAFAVMFSVWGLVRIFMSFLALGG